jgi:hypothetical protein
MGLDGQGGLSKTPGIAPGSYISARRSHLLLTSLYIHHLPFLLATMTTRPRAMSGTIPSMETSHNQLKDNTVIIGTLLPAITPFHHTAPLISPVFLQYSVHPEIWRRRR